MITSAANCVKFDGRLSGKTKCLKMSQNILQVLLNALDNKSRQYWEQGVKCYESSEYEMAKERFNCAVVENRTNYFACQYLGFISVHDQNPLDTLSLHGNSQAAAIIGPWRYPI